MDLRSVAVADAELPGRVRVTGKVRFDSDGQEELLWFDLPASFAGELSGSGNPWLVALIPLAVSLKEPLRLTIPVDSVLRENIRAVMQVWHSWYPERPPVAIEAPVLEPGPIVSPRGTGLFFSGGVDSFYSLLRHNGPESTTPVRITDLLVMHGADIPVSDAKAFARLRAWISEIGEALGTGVIDIATNLRGTRWGRADWPHLAHGALLAGSGLLLEPRLDQLVIASSAPHTRIKPYGSHPLTDPLYSTSGTRVIHDGAEVDRPAKLQAIASHPAVLRHLRVCWIGRTDSNCGRCPKCLHTMVGLELYGMLAKADSLPRVIDPKQFKGLYLDSRATYNAYDMVKQYRRIAVANGRNDLVHLLDRVIASSDRKRFVKEALEGLARRKLISTSLRDRMTARLFNRSVKY